MCKDEVMEKLAKLEEKVLGVLEIETAGGLQGVDTEELGQAVDILKDLAKAKYYCAVTLAMLEELEGEEGETMGYNRRRYASGRFAPRGRGSYGYEPMEWEDPMMGYEGGMMGASGGQGGSSGGSSGGRGGSGGSSGGQGGGRSDGGRSGGQGGSQGRSGGSSGYGYGMGYERYQEARMGYEQSKTAPNKRAMDEAAEEHLEEVMDTVREIWQDADSGARVRMKNALVQFVNSDLK